MWAMNICKVERCVVVTLNDKREQLNLMYDPWVSACSLWIHLFPPCKIATN